MQSKSRTKKPGKRAVDADVRRNVERVWRGEVRRQERARLARRLALGFAPLAWEVKPFMDHDDVANLLGVVSEDVRVLVSAGLLEGVKDQVAAGSVVAFLEQHGATWWKARGERQLDHLRAKLEHALRVVRGNAVARLFPLDAAQELGGGPRIRRASERR